MDALWKFLDTMDVRAVLLAAFNAGIFWAVLRKNQGDIKRLKRYKAWSHDVLSKLKMLHESKYVNEKLGDDWEEEA